MDDTKDTQPFMISFLLKDGLEEDFSKMAPNEALSKLYNLLSLYGACAQTALQHAKQNRHIFTLCASGPKEHIEKQYEALKGAVKVYIDDNRNIAALYNSLVSEELYDVIVNKSVKITTQASQQKTVTPPPYPPKQTAGLSISPTIRGVPIDYNPPYPPKPS